MDGEAADVDDPVPLAPDLPGHRTRELAVDLGDEEAVQIGDDPVAVVRPARRQERAHVVVRVELDEEVDVAVARRPDRDRHGRTVAVSRRGNFTAPDASATPARISASPPSVAAVISSSRISAP